MRILLDTCVLSELKKPQCNKKLKETIEVLDSDQLFISVITIGEIAKGIELLDKGKRKQDFKNWLLSLEQHYADRILPIDNEICRIWGEKTAAAQKSGKIVSACDGLIAATALHHGLYLMTRNVNDFKPTGVMLLNPWE